MPTSRLTPLLETKLDELRRSGRLKGAEVVTRGVLPPADGKGPRFLIEGCGDKPFLRMNSNSYLGLSFETLVIAAEEEAARRYGTGPGVSRKLWWSGEQRMKNARPPTMSEMRKPRPSV